MTFQKVSDKKSAVMKELNKVVQNDIDVNEAVISEWSREVNFPGLGIISFIQLNSIEFPLSEI